MINFDYEKEKKLFEEELAKGEFSIITVDNREEDYYLNGHEDSKENRDTKAINEMLSSGCFDNMLEMK